MIKILFGIFIAMSLSANTTYSNNLDAWRDGFITAYKAMKIDGSLQGINSNIIQTKKYIIYFNANNENVAEWDKLMVQMFGYSSSIYKPIRTLEGYIIFGSYNNKFSAKQELELLNKKLFKNSKNYKLELLDNSKQNKTFYNAKTLLIDEIKDLQALLRKVNEIKLREHKKELDDNQKVAVVYVDTQTKKLVTPDTTLIPKVEQKNTKKSLSETTSRVKRQKKKYQFEEYVITGEPIKNGVVVFSKPSFDRKYKLRTLSKKAVLEISSKNGYGWLKIKGKKQYVQKHLIKEVEVKPKKKISKETKKKSVKKPVVISTKPVAKKEVIKKKVIKKKNYFILTESEAIVFKLKSPLVKSKRVYDVGLFDYSAIMKNNHGRLEFDGIISDTDGNKFIKIKELNSFIDLKAAKIIKEI